MFDAQKARADLKLLHEATSPIAGYFGSQVEELIDIGEDALAPDTIAGAYLENKLVMPADRFAILENLAEMMELDQDPEYSDVAELRRLQGAGTESEVI